MPSYNATIELTDRYTDELASKLVDELADYHPAASRGPFGHPEVVLTVQAETVRQAATTAIAVVQATGHDTYSLEVLPTEAFDQRLGLEAVPELLSVTEAAQQLGVSRQAVQQRIDAGTLPARKVGKTYAVLSPGLMAVAQRAAEAVAASGRPTGMQAVAQRAAEAVAASGRPTGMQAVAQRAAEAAAAGGQMAGIQGVAKAAAEAAAQSARSTTSGRAAAAKADESNEG